MQKKIFLGTKNTHKIREIQQILKSSPYELRTANEFQHLPEVEENAGTYEGNATLKAQAYAKATNMLCIADDAGLEVDFLQGAPGVESANWAGVYGDARYEANNKKLLEALKGVPVDKRTARFVCIILLADAQKVHICARGECYGRITCELKGQHGFGFDPLFEIEEYGKTFAELGDKVKNQISHRAKALIEFQRQLTSGVFTC